VTEEIVRRRPREAEETGREHLLLELDMTDLQLIAAVQEQRDLLRAASSLGLPPGQARKRYLAIERRLGRLFQPGPDGLHATDGGEGVVTRARRMLDRLNALESDVRNLRTQRQPLVVWAAAIVPFEKWLPPLRERLPEWDWSVRAVTAEEGMARLRDGEGDLFFGFRLVDGGERVPPLPRGVSATEILHEAGWVRLGTDHPAAALPEVPLSALADEVWAVLPQPDLEHGLVTACRRAGFEPDIRFRPTEPRMKDELAAAGEAVSLVSPLAGEDASVVMRPCVGGPVYAWTLAHRHRALPEPLVDTIAQVVRDDYRAMAASIPALRAALGPDGPTAP
jgi:DNA-binding transcriptional LysR family regulator